MIKRYYALYKTACSKALEGMKESNCNLEEHRARISLTGQVSDNIYV